MTLEEILNITEIPEGTLQDGTLNGFSHFLKQHELEPKTVDDLHHCIIVFIKFKGYEGLIINPEDYKLNMKKILGTDEVKKPLVHKGEKETIHGTMKPITSFKEFSEIIDVFKEPPFSEPLSIIDKIEEFEGYLKHGLALACYDEDGTIISYAGLMEEVEDEHTPYFDNDVVNHSNPLYIFGLATKNEYRGYGACSALVELVDELAVENGTDFVYLRTNKEGSMSAGLCYKQGYGDLWQNGEKVVQVVEFERNDPTLDNKDERIFLIKAITPFGNEMLKFTGAIPHTQEEMNDIAKQLIKKPKYKFNGDLEYQNAL